MPGEVYTKLIVYRKHRYREKVESIKRRMQGPGQLTWDEEMIADYEFNENTKIKGRHHE